MRYARERNIVVLLVNIPYLAQVYDEVWQSSFGLKPSVYDRWAGSRRIADICRRLEIVCVDATEDFIVEAESTGDWLHYKQDGHPTPAGHKVIARSIYRQIHENDLLTGHSRSTDPNIAGTGEN